MCCAYSGKPDHDVGTCDGTYERVVSTRLHELDMADVNNR